MVLFMSENASSERRILLAFALNLFFAVLEVFGGLFTGSVMIFSDAIHDFGDCLVLGLSFGMEHISGRPADERFQFGYRRFSVLAGLINSVILLIGGTIMIVTAVERVLEPRGINGPGMLLFAIFGIIINGAAVLITSKGNNINERSICTHMLEDVLTWIAVLIVGIVLCFRDIPVLDSILAILMTIIIFIGVIKNLLHVFSVFIMKAPLPKETYHEICRRFQELYKETAVVSLQTFSMDGETNYAFVRVKTRSEFRIEDWPAEMKKIRELLREYELTEVFVQGEPLGETLQSCEKCTTDNDNL